MITAYGDRARAFAQRLGDLSMGETPAFLGVTAARNQNHDEAGRAVANNQFLKDLFQACMMHEVKYLAIAVRLKYRGKSDFEQVCKFFQTMYASRRLALPLLGILVIGY